MRRTSTGWGSEPARSQSPSPRGIGFEGLLGKSPVFGRGSALPPDGRNILTTESWTIQDMGAET
jgi:hypothetical protein